MIYLLGGPPRCGKTILARQLQQTLGCSLLPADYLGAAILPYLPAEQRDTLYPSVGRGLTNDERFRQFTTADFLAAFRTRARTAWAGLSRLIEYAIYEGQSYIIEGFQIEPELVAELQTRHGADQFRVAFLVKTDLAAITAGLQAATTPNDWARERTTDPTTYPLIAAWVQQYSQVIIAEAIRCNLPYFLTDDDFTAALAAAHAALIAPSEPDQPLSHQTPHPAQ